MGVPTSEHLGGRALSARILLVEDVDEHGRAFVTDSEGGRIWVLDAP